MPEPTCDELERWAAEQMGWTRIRPNRLAKQPNGEAQPWKWIPHYCDDLNATWQLIEKFGGGTVTLYRSESGKYVCELCRDENTYAKSSGATPAEALVRAVYAAALYAHAHKEEHDVQS